VTRPEQQVFHQSCQASEAESILDHITDRFDDNPQGTHYFYDLFRRIYCQDEELPRKGIQIGITCIQAPDDLIYAVGAPPHKAL
jgi:hypothetical protein